MNSLKKYADILLAQKLPKKLKSGETLLSAKVNNINPAHMHDAATISIILYTFFWINIPPIITGISLQHLNITCVG